MVQIFDPIDVGGNIGGALGKGFGDQFAREIQANRLGDQLESLREAYSADGSTYDPLKLITELTQIGARLNPEQGAAFFKSLPDIQRLLMSQQRPQPDAFTSPGGPAPAMGNAVMEGMPVAEQPQAREPISGLDVAARPELMQLGENIQSVAQEMVDAGLPDPRLSVQTPQQAAALRTQNWRRTPAQREAAINQLVRQYGWDAEKAGNYLDQQEARWNQIKDDLAQQASRAIETENAFRNTFDQELSRTWGDRVSDLLPGEVMQNYIARGIDELARNPAQSAEGLARKIFKEANQFMKDRLDLRNKTGPGGLPYVFQSTESLKQFQDNLARYRKNYEKAGALNTFEDDLKAQGFTDHYAASYARPLNPQLQQGLKDVPRLSWAARNALLKPSAGMQKKALNVVREAILKSYDRENDSLLALQTRLFELGYGPDILASVVADIQDERPDFFSARDERAIPMLIAPVDGDIRNIMLEIFAPLGTVTNALLGPTRYGRQAQEEATRRKTAGRFRK